MKKLFAFLVAFAALWVTPGLAQCVGAGGINNVPQPGITCASEPIVATYAATGIGIAPGAAATDIACITGASGKVVRVQAIRVSGSAGTLITIPIVITKHASANSGGTAATGTALPVPYAMDPNNAAAAATTTAYTANPTINDSTPGYIDASELSLNTTSALVGAGYANFDYTERNYAQAPILRSTAQQVCVNINATSPSSGLVNVTFKWTEQAQ